MRALLRVWVPLGVAAHLAATGCGMFDAWPGGQGAHDDVLEATGDAGAGAVGSDAGPDDLHSPDDTAVDLVSDEGDADAGWPSPPFTCTGTRPDFAAPEPDGPTIAFDDVTDVVGLPPVYGRNASWGDVNGDGLPDLFVTGTFDEPVLRETDSGGTLGEVYINCGGWFEPFGLRERVVRRATDTKGVASSAVLDIDEDGRADLMTTHSRRVEVLFQEVDGTFVSDVVFASDGEGSNAGLPGVNSVLVSDIDADGHLDLLLSRLGRSEVVLWGLGGRAFDNDRTPDVLATATLRGDEWLDSQTFASFIVSEPAEPAYRYLIVGDDNGIGSAFFTVRYDPFGLDLAPARIEGRTTMYFDAAVLDDSAGVLVVSTQTAAWQLHLLKGGRMLSVPERVVTAETQTGWGARFADFDSDGREDLVVATGVADQDPELRATWQSSHPSHLMVFRAVDEQGTRKFVDVSATAGPSFGGGAEVDWESVASADFDSDGCVDLAVAPLRTFRNRPWTVRYRDQIRVLRNRCNGDRRFVGFHLPSAPETRLDVRVADATGAEHTRTRVVRGGGAISTSDWSRVAMGLLPGDTLKSATIRCPDGQVREIDATQLAEGAYADLRAACRIE